MTIDLRPEQQQVVGRAIQAGLIQTADDVIEVGVETIRQQLEARGPSADGCGARSDPVDAQRERLFRGRREYEESLGGLTI